MQEKERDQLLLKIYSELKETKEELKTKVGIEEFNKRFDAQQELFEKRFRIQDERFAKQDERFAKQDERFAKQDERFAQQDKRFAKQDERFDKIENEISKISKSIAVIEQEHGEKIQALFDLTTLHTEILEDIREHINRHEHVIEKHDNKILAIEQVLVENKLLIQ